MLLKLEKWVVFFMMDAIIAYIEFLKSEYSLALTIHDQTGFLANQMYRLVPYNIHSNPYCLQVKSCKEAWDYCIVRQQKVFDRCQDGIFFGTCYAGVSEYVVPIRHQDCLLGFISVSGYRTAKHAAAQSRIDAVAKNYCLDKSALAACYEKYLCANPPSLEWVQTVITPLCCMLELYYVDNKSLCTNEFSENQAALYGRILSYIAHHYANPIKLSDISKACFCSVSHITQLFRAKHKLSVHQYITQLRLKEAARLLEQTDLSIQDIAYMVGFSDSNYFSSSFKKHYHLTPRQYRKKSHNS